ncbi:Cellulose synthase operon protein YhjU [Burkholderiales bacterium]|nr:Cellulose synthase operon protein YhjU [Burkholderiales bacterium]
MGAWSLYFLAKLGLYYHRVMGLHWLANVLLALALAWPLASARARLLRGALAIPAALALLVYDSYLPPWTQLIDDAGALGNFRAGYLLELARRILPLRALLALAVLVLAYALLRHRVRFATLAFLGLGLAAVVPVPGVAPPPPDSSIYVRAGEAPGPESGPEPSAPQLDTALDAFYGSERGKTVSFARAGPARFDLVLLSVCSLSNDDLDYTHLRDAPLLARFDIVFRQFNSAATYSGPAVLRLLHGTCGQTPQGELYGGTAPDACYLFRSLAASGYRPALLLNHDGHFDHFADQLRLQGGVGVDPQDNRGAPVAMTSFDGSPLRADFDLLSQWWARHEADEAHNVLLYNTISLHDGNRLPGVKGSSLETYAPRLQRLFSDLGRFLDLIEASGRPTVIVLMPEHGAALRGDAVQVAGLRELPTPAITSVPVAVKLVGFPSLAGPSKAPLLIDRPASYLALTALLAGLTQLGPAQASSASLQTLVRALPPTEWVAQNEATVVYRRAGRNYLRAPDGQWTDFAGNAP